MKKKILFINIGPFGSFTDTLAYYKYLRNIYDLTYLGFDENKTQKKYENINIIELSGKGNNFRNKIRFFFSVKKILKNYNFNVVMINYFLGSSFMKFFINNDCTIIDVRSGIITKNKFKRIILNNIIKLEVSLFKNITVISKRLKIKLNLPDRSNILPLGASVVNFKNKNDKFFTFLYVGTFHNRDMIKTIYAFKYFLDRTNLKERKKIKYKIVGFGSKKEVMEITRTINELNLSDSVFYMGEIRFPELLSQFESANIGVSFIPMTDFFDSQPPTKTFEYLLSGLPVLATNTSENRDVINSLNGVLVEDDIESFSEGFEEIFNNYELYSSEEIKFNSREFGWDRIIKNNLIPLFENLSK